jgi:Zn-finger nucleic acid-binding protein
MSSEQCPRCARTFERRAKDKAWLLACTTCGGVWIDATQSSRLLKHLVGSAALTSLAERASSLAEDKPRLASAVHCPFDGISARRHKWHGIVLDSCETHGTWFDAGEVERIWRIEHAFDADGLALFAVSSN